VLKELEQTKSKGDTAQISGAPGQLNFFSLDRPELEELADEIENVDVNQLKPIEALMLLNTLKEKLSKK
jgi:DNA mismatch repair protein MutS